MCIYYVRAKQPAAGKSVALYIDISAAAGNFIKINLDEKWVVQIFRRINPFSVCLFQAIMYEGQDKNPEMCRVLLTHEVMCR